MALNRPPVAAVEPQGSSRTGPPREILAPTTSGRREAAMDAEVIVAERDRSG